MDMCFALDDIRKLTKLGLPSPSDIKESEKSGLHNAAEKLMKKYGGLKGALVKKEKMNYVDAAEYLLNLIRVYMNILKPKKDQTGGRY